MAWHRQEGGRTLLIASATQMSPTSEAGEQKGESTLAWPACGQAAQQASADALGAACQHTGRTAQPRMAALCQPPEARAGAVLLSQCCRCCRCCCRCPPPPPGWMPHLALRPHGAPDHKGHLLAQSIQVASPVFRGGTWGGAAVELPADTLGAPGTQAPYQAGAGTGYRQEVKAAPGGDAAPPAAAASQHLRRCAQSRRRRRLLGLCSRGLSCCRLA